MAVATEDALAKIIEGEGVRWHNLGFCQVFGW